MEPVLPAGLIAQLSQRLGDEVVVHHGYWDPNDPWVKAGKDPMLAPSSAICSASFPSIADSTFTGNTATYGYGGAVIGSLNCTIAITDSTLST